MQKSILLLVSVVCALLIMPSTVLSEGKVGLRFGMEILAAYTYWENDFSKERFDNLGPGLLISPESKKQFGRAFFAIDMTLGRFHYNGPDGLILTSSEDDIDTGFRSRMNKRDLLLRTGYDFLEFLGLSINLRRNFLKLNADHKTPGVRYEYLEKGLLLGPGLNARLPVERSMLFLEMSYLVGHLNTDYQNSITSPRVSRNRMNIQILAGSLGVLVPLGKAYKLGFLYKIEYQAKSAKSSIFKYNPTDLWFQGLATIIRYEF